MPDPVQDAMTGAVEPWSYEDSLRELRRSLLRRAMVVNPAVTNYTFPLGYPSAGTNRSVFNEGITNVPNTVVVNGHGSQADGGYSLDQNYKDSRSVDEQKKFALWRAVTGLADFDLSDVASVMGPATNNVNHLINASCYGGDCKSFDRAKKLFPNLQSMVGSTSTNLFWPNMLYPAVYGSGPSTNGVMLETTPTATNQITGTNWPGWLKAVYRRQQGSDYANE